MRDGELAWRLREHSAAVMRYAASTAKRMGLEVSELAALEHLQAVGPMTLGHLAGRLSMSAGAVTTLVDRLVKKGYVERAPNPEDRRSQLVRGTGLGFEESLRHLLPYIREMREIEGGFTAGEREVVARYLEATTGAAHRHAASPRPEKT